MKRIHFATYEPFHYYAAGYRHTTIDRLATEWHLSSDQADKLRDDLLAEERDVIDFWISRRFSSEIASPQYFLDAIVRELRDLRLSEPAEWTRIYPALAPLTDELAERMDALSQSPLQDSEDTDSIYLFDAGWGGGLVDAWDLMDNYDLSAYDLETIRGALDSYFQDYAVDAALSDYSDALDDIDSDSENATELRAAAFNACVSTLVDQTSERYGTDFAYELEFVQWPDDIRDAVMTRVFGDDWRSK